MKIFGFFNRKKNSEASTVVDLCDFSVDQIIKMKPGFHTKNPYYVVITYLDIEAKKGQVIMTTSIPGAHSLNMVVGSNWEYHHKRMLIVGSKNIYSYLLYNQPLD